MKTAGIISKPNKPEIASIVSGLTNWLAARRIEALYDEETAASLGHAGSGLARPQLAESADLVLVLGGDGTLLAAARAVGGRGIPILAVNLGSLGFLTEVTLDEMYPALELVLDNRHEVDCRRKLMVEVRRDGEVLETYHALNDAVLSKPAIARIMDFDAFLDGQLVSNFMADGIIISTPTGSTAYSLSAGGPIVLPAVDAMVLTPIASHMLTNRPVVVPINSTVEVVVNAADESVILTVDGQVGLSIQSHDRVICRVSPQLARLVRPPGKSYFDVLRDKLHWGHR